MLRFGANEFLLKPDSPSESGSVMGRSFEPYDRVKEENSEARAAAKALIEEGKKAGPARRTFVFVNYRLEGMRLLRLPRCGEELGQAVCVKISDSDPVTAARVKALMQCFTFVNEEDEHE